MDRNLLGDETSPYLLQHKDNPVHWRPWGDAAFAAARAANKPILLSVGYAACHWCHVMAHESFETPEVATVMNRLFINVKVDREERPDVDALYQAALALMQEQGGWPLTMFLTPQGEPFWGGTYFPPEPRYGRPGFPQVLEALADAWANKGAQVQANVAGLRSALERLGETAAPEALSLSRLDAAARQILDLLDPVHGGLSGAPKFPQPSLFAFLWRSALRTRDAALRAAVLLTLERMCQGGIYDHLGGGFARYSTDEVWLVPHFEKMLYDNAQLVELLTTAWQQTRTPLFAQRVAETIGWLQREMLTEGGAFAATLDADSEGEEGAFYVWDPAEITRLLPADSAAAFCTAYGVTPSGNWEGKVILHRPSTAAVNESDEATLAAARATLFNEREKRPRPGRDDKILADWNGMMITALAQAAFAFNRPDWLRMARTAFDRVVALMADGDRLGHAYRAGRLQRAAMLDDYAAMARAALALYEITGVTDYRDHAVTWIATADRHYWDDRNGGYFLTADDATDLIVRNKVGHDAAVPSGNGMMAEALLRLSHLTGETVHRDRAETLIAAFSGLAMRQPAAMPTLLSAFALVADPLQMVLVGSAEEVATQSLALVIAERAPPDRILLRLAPDATLPASHPAAGKGLVSGQPAVYICRGMTCSAPVTTPDALRAALATR